MKRLLALLFITLFASTAAFADYDPMDDPKSPQYKAAAKKAAERRAEADKKQKAHYEAEMAKRKAEGEKKEADYERKKLGASAAGKTDSEVLAMAKARDNAREKANVDRDRKALGAAAVGKSDAEVTKMTHDKAIQMSKDVMANQRKALGAAAVGKSDAEVAQMSAGNASLQMKAMTGKSIEEMQKMSPAEQKAFMEQLEKKFGK